MDLGKQIKIARKKKNLSQAKLGELVGKTYSAICRWERDTRKIDYEDLEKLENILEIKFDYSKEIRKTRVKNFGCFHNWVFIKELEDKTFLFICPKCSLKNIIKIK